MVIFRMKFKDLLKLSTRMFKARTSRTLLTIVGMGVGISAILFLVALGYGLQNVLLEKITTADSLLSLDSTPSKESDSPVKINDEFISDVSSMEGVAEVSPVSQASSRVYFNELTSNIATEIVKPSFFSLDGVEVDYGTILDDNVENGIVVSSAFAKIFKEEQKEIIRKQVELAIIISQDNNAEENSDEESKTIEIDDPFTIIGMIEKEEPVVYVNLKDIQKYTAIPYYTRLKVKAERTDDLEILRSQLSSKGLAVASLSDTVDQVNKVFKVVNLVLALFGVIALAVSAIGMFNTMTVTLMERTEEIGIMKSIGVADRDILLMFVFESSIMGLFGGLAGIIIGMIGGKAFNIALNLLANKLGGETIQIFYAPIWFVGLILIIGAVVGFMTGLVPARRASSIDPLDALRYK